MFFIRRPSGAFIAVLLVASFCGTALAQSYSNKPIRLILPFPAAGPSDIVGRAVGQKLSEQLGENVAPDNRVGASGNLGLPWIFWINALVMGSSGLISRSGAEPSPK